MHEKKKRHASIIWRCSQELGGNKCGKKRGSGRGDGKVGRRESGGLELEGTGLWKERLEGKNPMCICGAVCVSGSFSIGI